MRRTNSGINAYYLVSALMSLICALYSISAFAFSIDELNVLLDRNPRTQRPVDSIEELVPLLPLEMRENFTFVYDSRSPFHGSITPAFPRVILFSRDARMMITFTGQPSVSGADVIETFSFNDRTAAFEPSARLLPAAIRRGEKVPVDTHTCTRCHGSDPRPIFDSYPIWPGFYGSVRDTFLQDSPLALTEQKNFLDFRRAEGKRGVYKRLVYPAGSPVSPFLDPSKLKREQNEANISFLEFLPNTRLGMALGELNRKRIFRKMSASERFLPLEKKLLAELLDCQRSSINIADVKRISKILLGEDLARLRRLGVDPTDSEKSVSHMQELEFARELAQIDWAAKQIEVSRDDWSMALEPASLSFFDGVLSGIYESKSFYGKEDILYELLSDLAARHQEFQPYFRPLPSYSHYPFGSRLDLSAAVGACKRLVPRGG